MGMAQSVNVLKVEYISWNFHQKNEIKIIICNFTKQSMAPGPEKMDFTLNFGANHFHEIDPREHLAYQAYKT